MSKSRTVLETFSHGPAHGRLPWPSLHSMYMRPIADGLGSGRQVAEDSEIKFWQDVTALGIFDRSTVDARIVVTEFMDFTCPFFAMVSPGVDSLLSRYPSEESC